MDSTRSQSAGRPASISGFSAVVIDVEGAAEVRAAVAGRLADRGSSVREYDAPDPNALSEAIIDSLDACDVILIIGGLGPRDPHQVIAALTALPGDPMPGLLERSRTVQTALGRMECLVEAGAACAVESSVVLTLPADAEAAVAVVDDLLPLLMRFAPVLADAVIATVFDGEADADAPVEPPRSVRADDSEGEGATVLDFSERFSRSGRGGSDGDGPERDG